MEQSQYDALWTCQVCGEKKVVPGLARDCEARHEQAGTLLTAERC